jgi:hypothetical protein
MAPEISRRPKWLVFPYIYINEVQKLISAISSVVGSGKEREEVYRSIKYDINLQQDHDESIAAA